MAQLLKGPMALATSIIALWLGSLSVHSLAPAVKTWTTSPCAVTGYASIGGTKNHVRASRTGALYMVASEEKAPKHDVGGMSMDQLEPDQQERVQAFMEYQQSLPKIGFPTDVRSLVQYNHGFAVMSTISKS